MSKTQTRKSNFYSYYAHINYVRLIYQGVMLALTKFPSLIVAVFLRKNFGERYFTLSACITFGIILLIPYFAAQELPRGYEFLENINFTWVLFILGFIGMSVKRRLEIKRKSRTIRVDRFSYFEGETNDNLWDWVETKTKIFKKSEYNVKRFYEPLSVFIVGVFLLVTYVASFVGLFLIIISILQYLRVGIQWAQGKDMLMDEVDKMIMKERMRDTLVFDKPASQTQGFSVFAPRPESQEIREKIVDQIFEEEKEEEVVTI